MSPIVYHQPIAMRDTVLEKAAGKERSRKRRRPQYRFLFHAYYRKKVTIGWPLRLFAIERIDLY